MFPRITLYVLLSVAVILMQCRGKQGDPGPEGSFVSSGLGVDNGSYYSGTISTSMQNGTIENFSFEYDLVNENDVIYDSTKVLDLIAKRKSNQGELETEYLDGQFYTSNLNTVPSHFYLSFSCLNPTNGGSYFSFAAQLTESNCTISNWKYDVLTHTLSFEYASKPSFTAFNGSAAIAIGTARFTNIFVKVN